MPLIIKNNVSKYENLYSSGHNHNYPNLDFVRLERKFLRNKTHNKILDYGFGSGENIIHLIKNNYNVYGIETSKSAIDLVKKKINSINKKKYNKKLILLREKDKKLKFENITNFFEKRTDTAWLVFTDCFYVCVSLGLILFVSFFCVLFVFLVE